MKKLLGMWLLWALPWSSQAQHFLFYNVENLFDTVADAHFDDEAFLPSADRAYNSRTYWLRQRQIARALRMALTAAEAHHREPISVIGLCEVENGTVVQDLARHAALRALGPWQVVHYDSPDHRGIDCAALVRTDYAQVLHSDRIRYSNDSLHTRDALYLELRMRDSTANENPVHLAVVHLPSKRGGATASDAKRIYALQAVSAYVDTLPGERWIIGDFNDTPSGPAVRELTNKGWAVPTYEKSYGHRVEGSYKYQGRWSLIDLALYRGSGSPAAQVLALESLMENDERWGNFRMRRAWQGTFFKGGYSDHLPVHIFTE